MQFLAYFLGALGCIFFLYIYNTKRAPKSTTKEVAPEPPGALPIIGHLHLLRGTSHLAEKLGNIADRQGPIYSLRLGSQRALVVSSLEMVKECFTINDKNFATRPTGSAFVKYMSFGGAAFGLAPYGTYWRDIRKIVSLKIFASQALHKLSHVWDLEAKYLIHDLSGSLVISDFIPWLEWMDIGGYVKGFQQSSKELDGVAGKWIEEHIQKEVSGDTDKESDLIQVMLATLPKETNTLGYTREDIIRATIVNIILAGTESTTETLIWAISLLLNNPHVIKAAQDELDFHVGRNKWVEDSDIGKLEYLQAIVKETLRLYPTGPLAAPHGAIEDCYVGGYYVPKGTKLIVNIWKLHHDSQLWPDPYEFRPERFLHEHSGVNYQGKNFEYIPFGAGRRMCPASTFASQVVNLTLARLLQGFDLAPPMGKPVDMSEGVGLGLPKVKPLEAVLTPRLSSELYQNV